MCTTESYKQSKTAIVNAAVSGYNGYEYTLRIIDSHLVLRYVDPWNLFNGK